MRVLKWTLIGVSVLLVGLLAAAFFLPDSAHVERSAYIDAPPKRVFDLVDDFRSFNRWSPWAEEDPDTVYQFSGPETGIGARMSWASANRGVGTGSQEVVAFEEGKRIVVALEFGEQGNGTAHYDIAPEGDGTRIVWGFDTEFGGDLPGRYFGLMMDAMIGSAYEQGLARLKALAEADE